MLKNSHLPRLVESESGAVSAPSANRSPHAATGDPECVSRFPTLLIEPDVRFSRIRLSDGAHTPACTGGPSGRRRAPRPARRDLGPDLLGRGVQRLVEPPERWWGLQALANPPPLNSLRRPPNQGPFPPRGLCCPPGPSGTMGPSDARRGPPPCEGTRGATPRRDGPPVLRWTLCRRATPPTPVSDPAVLGRLLGQDPAAFPVLRAGRRSRHAFRGLLGLHTCCGPSACRPTHGGPLSREPRRMGYPLRRHGSYWGVPTPPQAGLAPASVQRLGTALLKRAQMQGGARCEVRDVLGPYVAAHPLPPRQRGAMSERADAPPGAAEAAGRDAGPFSAAC